MSLHDVSLVPPSAGAVTLFDNLPPEIVIVTSREDLASELPHAKKGESVFIIEMTDERFGTYRVKDRHLSAYYTESALELHNRLIRDGRASFTLFSLTPFIAAYYLP